MHSKKQRDALEIVKLIIYGKSSTTKRDIVLNRDTRFWLNSILKSMTTDSSGRAQLPNGKFQAHKFQMII